MGFRNPESILRRSPITPAPLLETAAAQDGQAGVARERRVGPGAFAEGELRASRVADQSLMSAAIAKSGVWTGHRSDDETGGSSDVSRLRLSRALASSELSRISWAATSTSSAASSAF